MIIKWSYSPFCVLLLLSGDIQSNPGPELALELCSVCKKVVLDDHKAVCCDLCESWVHVSCDRSLTDDLHEGMVREDSNEPWICAVCSVFTPAVVTVGQSKPNQLSCACLNARSIVPKRFDLYAFICTFHIDILCITETFWIIPSVTKKYVQAITQFFAEIALDMVEEF